MLYFEPGKLQKIMGVSPEERRAGHSKNRIIVIAVLAFGIGAVLAYLLLNVVPLGSLFGCGAGGSPAVTSDPNRMSPYGEKTKEEAGTGPTAEELRLPKDVSPTEYRLKIKTYLPGYGATIPEHKNLTFDGQVCITLKVQSPTDKIVLNAKNLKFDMEKSALFEDETKKTQIALKDKNVNEAHEKVTFVAEKTFEAGQIVYLEIEYKGAINKDMGGLYQSGYFDADGTPKIVATTQMEPTDARQLVPCLDEPDYKATWLVTVVHPQGTTALSNGKEIETKTNEQDADYLETNYKPTPPMSSYLLAIIVSEFDHIEGTTKNGVRFRVFARPEAIASAKYALEAGTTCLTYYENWFNIDFPMEKQDMVALPDFAAGAMENWGLITYRETALLYHKGISTERNKGRVSDVIAHELAHMWFGNLVTMKWWDDLWLNEGFASLVEMFGLEHIHDHYNKLDGKTEIRKKVDVIQGDALPGAKDADAYATSHPLSFKIDKTKEVDEAFDAISYSKGASVMNMLREVMGPNNFDEGITEYLNKHHYNNAKAADLWDSLNKHTATSRKGPDGQQLDIPKFASQWTDKMGFPMLTVDRIDANRVNITQKRFIKNNRTQLLEKYANPDNGFKWDVPVWYQTGDDRTTKFAWLKKDEPLILNGKAPVIINVDGNGFYRTKYTEKEWKDVISAFFARNKNHSPHTRMNLIADAFEMASIGEMPYSQLFEMVDVAHSEEDPLVRDTLYDGMSGIVSYFGNEPAANEAKALFSALETKLRFKSHNNKFFENQLARELENFREKQLEGNVLRQHQVALISADVCSNRKCYAEKQQIWQEDFLGNCTEPGVQASACNKIKPGKRSSVYCFGVENSDDATFKTVLEFYKREHVQLERQNLLRGLTCSKNSRVLKDLLLTAMDRDSGLVRFQDVPLLFAYVSFNSVGRELMFDFFQTHWEQIYESFSTRTSIMESLIFRGTSGIRTPHQLNQLIDMVKTAPHAGTYHEFMKQIDRQGHIVQWNANYREKVLELIREKYGRH